MGNEVSLLLKTRRLFVFSEQERTRCILGETEEIEKQSLGLRDAYKNHPNDRLRQKTIIVFINHL